MKLLLNKEESAKVMEGLIKQKQSISTYDNSFIQFFTEHIETKRRLKQLKQLTTDYHELLNEVQTKVPGETRHQTTRRFIKEAIKEVPVSVELKEDHYGIL